MLEVSIAHGNLKHGKSHSLDTLDSKPYSRQPKTKEEVTDKASTPTTAAALQGPAGQEALSFEAQALQLLTASIKLPIHGIMGLTEHAASANTTPIIRQHAMGVLLLSQNIEDLREFRQSPLAPATSLMPADRLAQNTYRQIAPMMKAKGLHWQQDASPQLMAPIHLELMARVLGTLALYAMENVPENNFLRLRFHEKNEQLFIHLDLDGEPWLPQNHEGLKACARQVLQGTPITLSQRIVGLAFCLHVVEAHGGSIGADPTQPHCITISLPGAVVRPKITRTQATLANPEPTAYHPLPTLSPTETSRLKEALPKLQALHCAQVGAIHGVLKLLNSPKGSPLFQWCEQLQTAIYAGDETHYRQMLAQA